MASSQGNDVNSPAKPRTTYEVAAEVSRYAPTGGDTWQNVGMRQVPVRLLTELREAVERERRVKVAWTADPIGRSGGPDRMTVLEPTPAEREAVKEYAGAWRFDRE